MAFRSSDFSGWLEIGHGSFGTVYRARQISLNRFVCIKKSQRTLRRAIEERAQDEAASMAALQHPNLVSIHDFGSEEHCEFIVMEYVNGVSLEELATLESSLRAFCLIDACRGLTAIHRKGWIHRDIKPANLLVNCDGVTKVADFGLLFRTDKTAQTQESSVLGTVAYMAPEQVLGQELTPATDLFGLSSIFFEILTGEPPFRRPDIAATMHAIAYASPNLELVTDSARAVLAKGLAQKPQDRFASAEELGDALSSCTKKGSAVRQELALAVESRARKKLAEILLDQAERELRKGNRNQAYFHMAEASRLDPRKEIIDRLQEVGKASTRLPVVRKRRFQWAPVLLPVLALAGVLVVRSSFKKEDLGATVLAHEAQRVRYIGPSPVVEKSWNHKGTGGLSSEDALWILGRLNKPGTRFLVDGRQVVPQNDTLRIQPGIHSTMILRGADTLVSRDSEWKAFEIRKED